jgi:E3 ubiquitin-protein ligase DMA1/2
MLRRRRSAGDVAAPALAPQPITTSATAAAALGIGTRLNPPPAAATTTTPTTNHGCSRLIRLVPHLDIDAIGRVLKEGGPSLHIGRFTDSMGLPAVNDLGSNTLAFESKVVSRAHAEIWVESGGRFFVKDTKSSSGTFLNHVRLSTANTKFRPFQIKDGDILQFGVTGVDYREGTEVIHKSVEIKIELERASANASKYVTF